MILFHDSKIKPGAAATPSAAHAGERHSKAPGRRGLGRGNLRGIK